MKHLCLSIALALSLAGFAFAESAGKEITIKGKGCCLKCCLKQADECQNAVTVEKGDKKITYHLVQNDVSKAFHENICKKPADVVVTGTCKKVGDKFEVTASKIELAK